MKYLLIYAGHKAARIVREHGLSPDMVEVVSGAAGGPKWLVLCGLDRAVFGSWLMERMRPVHLVGSSVGSWRFAALAQGMDAYDRFLDAYLAQTYKTVPNAAMVSAEIGRILDAYLDEDGLRRALSHPHARLNVLSVRCSWPGSAQAKHAVVFSMALAACLNLMNRGFLRHFFSRALFFDSRSVPPFFSMNSFPIERISLKPDNLRQAVMASGSMPVLMEGIRDIPGARPGMYRDAGIIDYHLDIPYNTDSIVLYPHYMERITTGWFDKPLAWRRPDARNLGNVVMLCPSSAFVEKLPGGRIPTRGDFREFWLKDTERISFWKKAVEASAVLGDEFMDAVHSGSIADRIRPIEELCR